MEIKTLEPILKEHPFFKGMSAEHIGTLVGCASNARFAKGKMIFRQQEDADTWYLIREGKIAVEVGSEAQGRVVIQTLEEGQILGWSWLFPPHVWHFDARAVEATRAVALDGRCLRGKCENDPSLGYELMKRFSSIVVNRLQATRIQLMDIYGPKS